MPIEMLDNEADAAHELREEQRLKHAPPQRRSVCGTRTDSVAPWGFSMECQYEYTEGEPAVLWGDNPHPGAPAYCSLYACYVGESGGVDIMEMLDSDQIDRIEELLLEGIEQ